MDVRVDTLAANSGRIKGYSVVIPQACSNRVGTARGAGCKRSLESTAPEQQSETTRLIEDQYSKSD
jgi:hypothetical protein